MFILTKKPLTAVSGFFVAHFNAKIAFQLHLPLRSQYLSHCEQMS